MPNLLPQSLGAIRKQSPPRYTSIDNLHKDIYPVLPSTDEQFTSYNDNVGLELNQFNNLLPQSTTHPVLSNAQFSKVPPTNHTPDPRGGSGGGNGVGPPFPNGSGGGNNVGPPFPNGGGGGGNPPFHGGGGGSGPPGGGSGGNPHIGPSKFSAPHSYIYPDPKQRIAIFNSFGNLKKYTNLDAPYLIYRHIKSFCHHYKLVDISMFPLEFQILVLLQTFSGSAKQILEPFNNPNHQVYRCKHITEVLRLVKELFCSQFQRQTLKHLFDCCFYIIFKEIYY